MLAMALAQAHLKASSAQHKEAREKREEGWEEVGGEEDKEDEEAEEDEEAPSLIAACSEILRARELLRCEGGGGGKESFTESASVSSCLAAPPTLALSEAR